MRETGCVKCSASVEGREGKGLNVVQTLTVTQPKTSKAELVYWQVQRLPAFYSTHTVKLCYWQIRWWRAYQYVKKRRKKKTPWHWVFFFFLNLISSEYRFDDLVHGWQRDWLRRKKKKKKSHLSHHFILSNTKALWRIDFQILHPPQVIHPPDLGVGCVSRCVNTLHQTQTIDQKIACCKMFFESFPGHCVLCRKRNPSFRSPLFFRQSLM